MNKLFLIDGHALIFKMYYAFLRRPMINSKGMDMSILYGFTKYMLELIHRESPTHLAVAFDPPGGTFRNQMYPEYKANRPPTPQLIIDSLEPLMELCQALGIETLIKPGFEADDVIGTVAKKYGSPDTHVFMVTPDKDYGQLVDDNIFQIKPGKSGGEDEIFDKAGICGKYGICDAAQVVDMLAICGDTADNVPGVKGVGEVGAGKLIAKYGSVEGIYEHLGELSAKQQAMFAEAEPHIGMSRELVTIKTDVPVDTRLEDMLLTDEYSPVIVDLFEKYEFTSLNKYIRHIAAPKKEGADIGFTTIAAADFRAAGCCAVIVEAETEGIFGGIGRITVSNGSEAAEGGVADFKSILEDPDTAKIGVDLKRQLNLLAENGVELRGKLYDIELMHYLIDPEKSHKIENLAKSYLGTDLEAEIEENEPLSLFDMAEDLPEEKSRLKEAVVLYLLKDRIESEMESSSTLYDTMEEPLSRVLARMERTGVRVDLKQLDIFAHGLREEMNDLEAKVREMAGEPSLNVSSPKQVGEVLFDKLRLDPKAKKSSRGAYSTDEQTLVAIAYKHPIVDTILEFRAVKKLLSTYIEPFPSYVSRVTGKVHTTFNQALTATGRLSSSNPNLQNIPIRTERGKEIRKAFVPSTPEGFIMSADYSQIELRIMAHLCGDAHMIAAFRDGLDVHAATAAKIYGIPVEDVTSEQRRTAKMANFGIMYGISSFGLAQRLHVPRTEAKKLIDDYFAAFPSIRTFIDDVVASARENGYVETIFGRRRYLPDINAKNATVRSLAERNAVNAPIQGSSADIIKMAMIGVDRRIREAGLQSRMVLQIHDELVFDAVETELETLRGIILEEMENVIELSIPLTVECNYGKNWLEAH